MVHLTESTSLTMLCLYRPSPRPPQPMTELYKSFTLQDHLKRPYDLYDNDLAWSCPRLNQEIQKDYDLWRAELKDPSYQSTSK